MVFSALSIVTLHHLKRRNPFTPFSFSELACHPLTASTAHHCDAKQAADGKHQHGARQDDGVNGESHRWMQAVMDTHTHVNRHTHTGKHVKLGFMEDKAGLQHDRG